MQLEYAPKTETQQDHWTERRPLKEIGKDMHKYKIITREHIIDRMKDIWFFIGMYIYYL